MSIPLPPLTLPGFFASLSATYVTRSYLSNVLKCGVISKFRLPTKNPTSSTGTVRHNVHTYRKGSKNLLCDFSKKYSRSIFKNVDILQIGVLLCSKMRGNFCHAIQNYLPNNIFQIFILKNQWETFLV